MPGPNGVRSCDDGRSNRCRYSSTSSRESSSRYSAYVRRNVLTKVGPGSRSHSSFSSARRYFARIFVAASTSVMSMRRRMRVSRSVSPISGMSFEATSVLLVVVRNRLRVARQRGQHARQIGLGHEHLTRLGSLVAADDAAPLEHVDQAARTRVAEPQA